MSTKQQAPEKTPSQPRSRTANEDVPTRESADLMGLGTGTYFKGRELPRHATNRPLRRAMVMRMQRRNGNAYARRVVSGLQQDSYGLFRQSETEEADPNAPLPVAGLGVERELSGHGLSGVIQRQGGGSPTANISLNVNPANIVRLPEATISANHGRAGVAGWCTPSYNVQPTARTANSISLTVTLDFTIELASEYTGGRLSVLSDHENGHVIIGERVAQQHFVNGLQSSLQSLPNFSSIPPIQAAIVTAANNFVRDEGQQSRAYDTSDYPRMREAYLGVRTPLADLAAASPAIQGMVQALRAFIAHAQTIESSQPENPILTSLAQDVIDASVSLSGVDISRLQYNPEFKNLVFTAHDLVNVLKDSVSLDERPYMEEVELVLNRFHWSPSP